MARLRQNLIRLAFEQPNLRPHLLPLVRTARKVVHRVGIEDPSEPEIRVEFTDGSEIIYDWPVRPWRRELLMFYNLLDHPEAKPRLGAALSKLTPEDAEWFHGKLVELARRLGGRVVKDTSTSFVFTYPKNPAVKDVTFTQIGHDRVLFWITNVDGLQGTGWDEWRGVVHDPSNHVNLKLLLSRDRQHLDRDLNSALNGSLVVDLKHVFSEATSAEVTGLRKRDDLKPQSRGWSTNPNTHREPTFYEVLGNLDRSSEVQVLKWLKANKPNLLPGSESLGYGASTETSLDWDARQNAWIITSRFTYTGG